MSSQPSKKRSHKNKRHRSNKQKKRAKDISKALAASNQRIFSGKIENFQCIFNLLISKPGSTGPPSKIEAIIDTGATGIAIRADVMTRLGLPLVGTTRSQTPSGTEQSEVVAAELILESKGKTLTAVMEAVVYKNMLVPMLFGMKAMHGGVLTVDTIVGEWELRYKKFIDSP